MSKTHTPTGVDPCTELAQRFRAVADAVRSRNHTAAAICEIHAKNAEMAPEDSQLHADLTAILDMYERWVERDVPTKT